MSALTGSKTNGTPSIVVLLTLCLATLSGCTATVSEEPDLTTSPTPSATPSDTPSTTPSETPEIDACIPVSTSLASGTTTYIEDFNQGGTAAFDIDASCWNTYRSAFSFMTDADLTSAFSTATVGGTSQNVLLQTVHYRTGMHTNTTVTYTPYSTPATGWDSGQWPYVMDLVKQPQCYADVTLQIQNKPINTGSDGVIRGAILNATVTGTGSTRKISGYFIYVNGGGNSVTLVRLIEAYDHAFDFFDHFPGSFGQPNPKTDGPYKGWEFKNNVWAAGGGVNMTTESTLAARYAYDSSSGDVTISWEVRPANGVDGSSGSWDKTVTLTGADALSPTGNYGHFTSFYGALGTDGANSTTANGTALGQLRLDCVNP